MDENPGSYWTLFAVVGGPILLGLAFAYAKLRGRPRRTEADQAKTAENWGKEVKR